MFQEQVIEETDPRYEKILEEVKKTPEKKSGVMPVDISGNEEIKYLDPESMNQILRQAEQMNSGQMLRKKNGKV